MKAQFGVLKARCAVAVTDRPVFQQCGTMMRPRAAARSQTFLASMKPPTRPTSGCATSILPRSIRPSNSQCVASHSPDAIFIGLRRLHEADHRVALGQVRAVI